MIANVKAQKGIPKKTYTPVNRMMAVHPYPPDETAGGLVMPDGVKDPTRSPLALVIAIGPEVKYVKEGDTIIYINNMQAIFHQGQRTGLMHEDNVAGVVIPS